MAVLRFHPVFLLSLACFQAAAAAATDVMPPVNVTLTCRNLHNVVSWGYGEFLPGLKFEVKIGSLQSEPQVLIVDPPALSAVIPFPTDPKDDFRLKVRAFIGQSKSAPAPPNGIIFSYYTNSPSMQKCDLDFPPVTVVDPKDGYVHFHFTHPMVLLSQELSDDPDLSDLEYDAAVNNQAPKRFTCFTSECEGKLPAPEEKKLCVKISRGEMEKMAVKAAQEYCTETDVQNKTDFIIVYIISGLSAAAVIGLVIYLVFKQKTKPSTYTPKSIDFVGKVKQWTIGITQEQIVSVDVEPRSPTPLLTPEEMNKVTPTELSPAEPVLHLRTGVSVEDEGVCGDEESENGEPSGYMHGRTLEDGEEPAYTGGGSGYEKREQVLVSIAPDEQAKGYRN